MAASEDKEYTVTVTETKEYTVQIHASSSEEATELVEARHETCEHYNMGDHNVEFETVYEQYESDDEELPMECDKCGNKSFKYCTELFPPLGDDYYCFDCISGHLYGEWNDTRRCRNGGLKEYDSVSVTLVTGNETPRKKGDVNKMIEDAVQEWNENVNINKSLIEVAQELQAENDKLKAALETRGYEEE